MVWTSCDFSGNSSGHSEKKVIEEQDLDWIVWADDEKTKLDLDVISGVTITADTYIKAIEQAMQQAKK